MSQDWLGTARSFGPDRRGAVAVIFCLCATVLLGLVGGGVDYARLAARRAQLQAAVDAGVLAGGNALKLAMSTTAAVIGVTEQTVRSEAKSPSDRPLTVQVTVASDKTNVAASAAETFKLTFGSFVGMPAASLTVKAQASVVGRMRLCMLTLDPFAAGSFNLQKNAQVTAYGCSLYSNSVNATGMVGGDNAMARADTICSAGGYLGLRANFAPVPQAGCPAIDDPLKNRASPTIGACLSIPLSANKKGDISKNEIDQNATLDPGTYCGGLKISKNAVVTLKSGTYVIKDGPLMVYDKGTLSGTDVSLYFSGNTAGLLFDKGSTISLSAPTLGVMAGLLISEERTVSTPLDPVIGLANGLIGALLPALGPPPPTPAPLGQTKPMRTYRIISDNARTMLGTIYLPAGRLVIDATKPVADQSAYTVIVAQQINLYEGPNLVLNANYSATSVPVPKGVGPVSGRLLLTQ
ncbi:pilus assembly protein TadG-related protein [Methylobacterium sp. E-025]|uniref:pilus assembly protein TadG-related protein n=1 Tax=Methylobacterium sp. E-025 TaxID=2836561 RepID=UPI001FBB1A23|nr:pilus assembly protein TadG-related protein [Methylobacterium sp. E-025]MCJ2110244.1 pilus assembly protein TadG-related protein [Methylobacterium sp. E-025]